MKFRRIGTTDIEVSPVALGCWPIAGMTSLEVNEADSLATLRAAKDSGVNFFDTAYCYGPRGESERLIATALGTCRDEIVIATKAGICWDDKLQRQLDGRPQTLKLHCEESLRRLNTDHVDLLYLHGPDPTRPIEQSAAALKQLMGEGKTRAIGLSNCSLEQLQRFHSVCPVSACQPAYNMLQRQIESDVLPWCRENKVAVFVYWPLMKGLLAGKLPRDHRFDPRDGRAKYPMFQGEQWQRNQDFVDDLRAIAEDAGQTTAQLVVNWTIHQPGITGALCGAKRAQQIQETAAAMNWQLTNDQLDRIVQAMKRRGTADVTSAV